MKWVLMVGFIICKTLFYNDGMVLFAKMSLIKTYPLPHQDNMMSEAAEPPRGVAWVNLNTMNERD